MKIPQCEHEQEVIEALRSGRWAGAWGQEIRMHAAACPVCSEVALVAEALGLESKRQYDEAPLPSPGLIWWKSQLALRRAAEERAAQPIALAERVAQVFGLIAALGLSWWQWPRILGWWAGSARTLSLSSRPADYSDWLRRVFDALASILSQSPTYLVVASTAAFLMLLAFAAYVVWREE